MELLAGVYLIVVGAIMLIKPDVVWKITESWKTRSIDEPTRLYINIFRISGCFLILYGVLEILDFTEGI